MKKTFILVIFLGILFLSFSVYCQDLTGREWKVYYDVAEGYHEILYEVDRGEYPTEEHYNRIYQDIANKYNISIKEVKDIDSRGLDREPTAREYEIVDDLMARINALPEDAGREDFERVDREVANKYGLSLLDLHEIDYRVGEWDSMYWF